MSVLPCAESATLAFAPRATPERTSALRRTRSPANATLRAREPRVGRGTKPAWSLAMRELGRAGADERIGCTYEATRTAGAQRLAGQGGAARREGRGDRKSTR